MINLPVEFNASSRARQILLEHRMVTTDEDKIVGKVLNAAAIGIRWDPLGNNLQIGKEF